MSVNSAKHRNTSFRKRLRDYSVPTLVMMTGIVLSIVGFMLVLNDNYDELQNEFSSLASVEAANISYELRDYSKSVGAIAQIITPNKLDDEDLAHFMDSLVSQMPLDGLWWITHYRGENNEDVIQRVGGAKNEMLDSLSPGAIPHLLTSLENVENGEAKDFITQPFAHPPSEPTPDYVALVHLLKSETGERKRAAVVGVLNYREALESTLAWVGETKEANLYVFRADSESEPALIYRYTNETQAAKSSDRYDLLKLHSPFSFEHRYDFPSQRWILLFTPTREYVGRASGWIPWVVLLCGLIITGLVGMFLLLQVTREQQIKKQVQEKTREMRQLTKELQEKEGRFRAVVDNTVDGMITINEAGRIKSFNPACEKLFGYKAHEVLDRNVSILMPEPFRHDHDKYMETYKRTGEAKIIGTGREVMARRKSGEIIPIELTVSEVKLHDRTLFSGIIRDISQRKKAQSELRDTADALSASNAKLEQFAYVASHDLRAPLRAIDNLSAWIEEDLGPELKGDSKRHFELLRGRVARMDRLLSDLLEYSRVGRMGEENEPRIQADKLLEDIVHTLSVPEGFTITVSDKFKNIELERMPIKQVFYNLIGNAIKHHDRENGHIKVSVENEDDDLYHFQVSDDGPGIPRHFHAKVFQMFQTLKPRDEVEGSGVGLTLVEKIVKQHGGKVTLVSDVGIGTTILFTWKKLKS